MADETTGQQQAPEMPRVGEPAPDFTLPNQDGEMVHLAGLRGKPVVLYFYPKDDTPGCTAEACNFRDAWGELQRRGVVVLGISADSVKSHAKFAEKYGLPFPLLADEEKLVANAYGTWVEKSMYGRHYMGVARTTFYITPEGTVGHIWEKVKPDIHSREVLDYLATETA